MKNRSRSKSEELDIVICSIADHEGADITSFSVISDQVRDFSRVTQIRVEFLGKISRTYFIKFAKTAFLQYKRLHHADKIFKECGSIFKLSPFFIEKIGALVCRNFSGMSLNAMLHVKAIREPVRWYRQVKEGTHLAGIWLRHYHENALGKGSDESILLRFINENASSLDLLMAHDRDKLIEQARLPIVGDPVVPHGDYTMRNVLVNRKKICVIDVGLGSLPYLTANWDIVTFKVSFERTCRFNARTPLHWIPILRDSIYKSFEDGYGKSSDESRDYFLCLATRHFIFLETALERKNVDVVKWHLDEISRSLARL